MGGRILIGIIAAVVVVGAGVALAQEDDPGRGETSEVEETGLPPFLTGDQELPPGLAKKDVLPPGLAKKPGDDVPPGQAKKEGEWTPPGQAKKEGVDAARPGQEGGGLASPGIGQAGQDPTRARQAARCRRTTGHRLRRRRIAVHSDLTVGPMGCHDGRHPEGPSSFGSR
jgi:hypothetical protein